MADATIFDRLLESPNDVSTSDLFKMGGQATSAAAKEMQEASQSEEKFEKTSLHIDKLLNHLNASEANALAGYARGTEHALIQQQKLWDEMDAHQDSPFFKMKERWNSIFNPDETLAGMGRQIQAIDRQQKIDSARLKTAATANASRRIELEEARQQAKLAHNAEVRQSAMAAQNVDFVNSLIEQRRLEMRIEDEEFNAQVRLLKATSTDQITSEWLARNNIAPQIGETVLMSRRMAENTLTASEHTLHIQALEYRLSQEDLDTLTEEQALERGYPLGMYREAAYRHRINKASEENGQLAIEKNRADIHEYERGNWLKSAPQGWLENSLMSTEFSSLAGAPNSVASPTGTFEYTFEEISRELEGRSTRQIHEAGREAGFNLAVGGARRDIEALSRMVGIPVTGNTPMSGQMKQLLEHSDFPAHFQPIANQIMREQMFFEQAPQMQQKVRQATMTALYKQQNEWITGYGQSLLESLPQDVRNGALDYFYNGKVSGAGDAAAMVNSLSTFTTGDMTLDRGLHAFMQHATFLEQAAEESQDGDEIAELIAGTRDPAAARLGAIVAAAEDPSVRADVFGQMSNRESLAVWADLGKQLLMPTLLQDLISDDPSGIMKDKEGRLDIGRIFKNLPLYIREANKQLPRGVQPLTEADVESAYIDEVTKRLTQKFTPAGDGALHIAALNKLLFNGMPVPFIKDYVVKRAMSFNMDEQAIEAEQKKALKFEFYKPASAYAQDEAYRKRWKDVEVPGAPFTPSAFMNPLAGEAGAQLIEMITTGDFVNATP